ncbi:hypothetical protein [Bacillus xiapuensis]|uniref:hypothetical protein n=1 Tax=Bacillus xiapuensis TaxID=2014075 RepID=UPI000C23C355|nr:hypothetical protein [Bacillus xiapuensis]
MLIDINLLPEKEKKRFPVLYAVLLAALLLAFLVGGYLLLQMKKNELSLVESRLQSASQLRETLEMSRNEPDGDEERLQQLKQAIAWAEQKKEPLAPVLKHLIERLPERGFFQTLDYSSTEKMTLTVQFDSARQAAYYLNDLKASDWVASAEMVSMKTSIEEEEEEAKKIAQKWNILPRYVAEYDIVFKPTDQRGEKNK